MRFTESVKATSLANSVFGVISENDPRLRATDSQKAPRPKDRRTADARIGRPRWLMDVGGVARDGRRPDDESTVAGGDGFGRCRPRNDARRRHLPARGAQAGPGDALAEFR